MSEIAEVAIEVIQEISAALIIVGVIAINCLWTTDKPEPDKKWDELG
jgi:hypothetical protein